MSSKKIFFISFGIAFSVMLSALFATYWFLETEIDKSVDTKNNNVPILSPGPKDSKSVLMCIQQEDTAFFCLIKFNALQQKVSFVAIPSDTFLPLANRTLKESLDYAGMMQCVYDFNSEFELPIDYHILCDCDGLTEILSSFSGFNLSQLGIELPPPISDILLKGEEYIDGTTLTNILRISAAALDNPLGVEFIANVGFTLLKNNLTNLKDFAIDDIKENFSYLSTNFNVQNLDSIKRVLSFLADSDPVFEKMTLENDSESIEMMQKMLNE